MKPDIRPDTGYQKRPDILYLIVFFSTKHLEKAGPDLTKIGNKFMVGSCRSGSASLEKR